ncbi:MAG: hypothetical protein NZ899_00550 [Thermoguttaceae bacterium]|nr:hypothetical protein [Thermoguttaceae bacterium]MDW8077385.1 hypothetical protein [Thermoguttaceae bacterium]
MSTIAPATTVKCLAAYRKYLRKPGGSAPGMWIALTIGIWVTGIFGGLPLAWAEVPSPWTPVDVTQEGAQVTVSVWGRKILWQEAPLPQQIFVANTPLLAGPVSLQGATETGALSFDRGGVIPWELTEEKATLLAWGEGEDLVVNVFAQVEYDGLSILDIKLVPPARGQSKLGRLWLEIPLRPEVVRLFHYWPGRWGSAANSGPMPADGLRLPFKPVLWVGWEEGGLAVMAEDPRSWRPKDPQNVLEVIPGQELTLVRLHLLDDPPPRLPTSFRVMLQATPVKPWPKDFHSWHICHGANYGMEKPAANGGESLLDKAAGLGVRTLVFHEHWTPVQNYWRTDRESDLIGLVEACHRRNIALWLYFGYELSTLAPEFAEEADRVLVRSSSGGLVGGYWRQPAQRDYIVCLASPWAEKLLAGIVRAIDRYNIDGVYLDGTIEPFGCANEAHGCGYRTADGSRGETYPILAVRRFMERLYRALESRGKRINAHQSSYCGPATLAFVHSYWDGEHLQGPLSQAKTLQELPLDTFRAEFMGRNFGVPCEFLVYEKPPAWTLEKAMAVTMLHDVRVRPLGVGPMLERIAPIWQAMEAFRVGEAEWYAYWRNEAWLKVNVASVKVSGYRRKVEGKTRWLLVISNLSEEAIQTVAVEVTDPELAAVAGARDAVTGETIEVAGRSLRLPVAPMNMRLVEVW